MSDLEPETPAKVARSVPSLILYGLLFVIIAFVVLVLLAYIGGLFMLQAIYAVVVGWVIHGFRVLPDFFEKWPAAVLPLAALILAWLVAHRLLRWWLATLKHHAAQGWTMWRTGALLGLVLLCGAAAVAISGVAHQAMWLGQTKWTESNRRAEWTMKLNDTRQLMLMLLAFDADHGRLPHSWDELLRWDDYGSSSNLLYRGVRVYALPILTHPGSKWREMSPETVLVVSDLVEGRHAVGLADNRCLGITPQQLNALIARGDWLLTE